MQILARIPRETKVAAAVLAVALLQVGALAALGLGQTERRRQDAEQSVRVRAKRSVLSLIDASRKQVAAQEDRLRAELDRDDRPIEARVQEALRRAPLFVGAHLVDARGEPVDVSRPPFDVPPSVIDMSARRQLAAVVAGERGDPSATAGAAADRADELERSGSGDVVAIALALQCGARSALVAGDLSRALTLARRTLGRYRAVRDDRAVEGEGEPFGPCASLVACEALLRALPTADDLHRDAFVDAVVDRRVGAQRLRGLLSEPGYRTERDDCVRLRREATSLPIAHQKRLDAALRECDDVDAALDRVRAVPRSMLLAATARDEVVRVPLADGGLLLVASVRRATPWTAVAFTAPAESLRKFARDAETDRGDEPEGTTILIRDASGAIVAGRAAGTVDAKADLLAEESFGAAFPGLFASSLLTDPAVVDREADAARRYWLWVLGGAMLAVAASSLLMVRAVMREVRLARLKSDFVSNLSHELRTPLTSLRMFVDTLREGRVRDEAEAKECLDVIAQETDRLSSLVERVLQFAAFARGRAPIELRDADVADVVRRSVQLFRKRAEAAGAVLETAVSDDLPEAVVDRDAIAQVLLNLLDNAVKHAGHDHPRIRVTARPHPPGGGRGTAVLVEDNGPGVPERERELVFEEFYRGDDSLSRRTQGAGLGLALSRRIVLAHGGTLDVSRSADLGGAAFRMVLPPPDAARAAVAAAGRRRP
ncbi:MAG: HAMP domain-containing histidine kinase [Planctomycetes bacterium]|nr:HAMP domain-containing histidine kinase [Planctomycetota bacterium]